MNKKNYTNEDIERGRRLKAVREMNNLTQEDLAGVLNVSVSMVKKLESGENNITLTGLKKLKDKLGVSSDFILFGDPNDNKHEAYSIKSASKEDKVKILIYILSHFCGIESEKCEEIIDELVKTAQE